MEQSTSKLKYKDSKLREGGYLHRRDLAYASSSCRELRWRVKTNRGRAAYAADVRGVLVHSIWPAPRDPARATKQNRVSKVSHRQGTKKPRKNRHAGRPQPFLFQFFCQNFWPPPTHSAGYRKYARRSLCHGG